MNNKIKKIRVDLGFSEAQISSLLNISCYKYKGMESGVIEITSEVLLLFSVILDIPVDYLICSKYSAKDVCDLPTLKKYKKIDELNKITLAEKNVCLCSPIKSEKASYRIIRSALNFIKTSFGQNLYILRTSKKVEVAEISNFLQVSPNDYILYEKGEILPSPSVLENISLYFNLSIDSLIKGLR